MGRFDLQARDALAVADAIGSANIGLWGYSQGAWVAPMAATLSPRIQFLVLVASAGVTPAVQMRYAVAEQLRRGGHGPPAVERALKLRARLEAWIHNPTPSDAGRLSSDLAVARSEAWWSVAFLPNELPDAAKRAAWIAEMDFDPVPVFAATSVPVLAIYGADDAWTPVDASVEAWRRARGDAADILVVPDASHELRLSDGRLSPMYEERMLGWLSSVA